MSNTYSIIGAGAVGGFYGAMLVRAGFDVRFLVRRNLALFRENGLRVLSPDGDVMLPTVEAYDDVREMPRADVVIVALKATANATLPNILPHLVRPGGIVVVMQNGLGNEEAIAGSVGTACIVGALAFVAATKEGPGTIRHHADRDIKLAVWSPDGRRQTAGASIQQLADDFRLAGIPVHVHDDLGLMRWQKLIWSIPFGGLCITTNTCTHGIINDPHLFAIARAVMADVAAAAKACGHDIDNQQQKVIDETIAMPTFVPSIKVDFDAGHEIEIETLYGNPVRAARRAGYPASLIEQLRSELESMDRARSCRA